MKTYQGRVVYNRKFHPFTFKDVDRIVKSLREGQKMEPFAERFTQSLIQTFEILSTDFPQAFIACMDSLVEWGMTGKLPPPAERGFIQDLEETLYSPPQTAGEVNLPVTVWAEIVAHLLSTIEEIEKFIEEETE